MSLASRWSLNLVPAGYVVDSSAFDSSKSRRASACGVLVRASGPSVSPYSQLCFEEKVSFLTKVSLT